MLSFVRRFADFSSARAGRMAVGCVLGVGLAASAVGQTPASSAFTYQGQLQDGDGPIHGTADVIATLYGAAAGGAPLGTVNLNNIAVTDGLFTATLNFGVDAFVGDARWIEFSVRSPAGSGTFTPLSPRQPVTVAPVAWHAMRPWKLSSEGGYGIDLPTAAGQINGVGIGTGNTLPAARLHVRAGAFLPAESLRVEDFFARSQLRISTPESQGKAGLQAWNGQNNTAGVLTLNAGGGNVGIGTNTPSATLDVAGTIEADHFKLTEFGFGEGQVLTSDASGYAFWGPGSPWTISGSTISYAGSRVGIGMSTPEFALDVRVNEIIGSSATVSDQHNAANRGTKVSFGHRVAGSPGEFVGMRTLIGPGTNGCGNTADIRFDTWECGTSISREIMRISGRGNVGIGTATPAFPLHVVSAAYNAATIESANPAGTWLDLRNSSVGGRYWQLISTGSANGGGAGNLLFAHGTSAGSTDGTALTITDSFDVGIGTVTPAAKLDVAGTARVRVLQITGGSDVAEPFNVNAECRMKHAEIQPGMVVAIDSSRIGELRLSSKAYDRTVAGIISGANGVNPGMVLTQEGSIADGKHPVALTGRVWAWCDADASGPIVAGDLLTTSNTAGHAMRVSDHDKAAGAIIGKAMSPLNSGKGLVLVLVSLQ